MCLRPSLSKLRSSQPASRAAAAAARAFAFETFGPSAPAGFPYYGGSPFPQNYPVSSYPQYGGQPIGSFTGFWDPFYAGRGAGQAGQYGLGC